VRRPFARLVALGVAVVLAVSLLPGTALAAGPDHLILTSSTGTTTAAGVPVTFTAAEYTSSDVLVGPVAAANLTYSLVPGLSGNCVVNVCTFSKAGTATVLASMISAPAVVGSIVMNVTVGAMHGFIFTLSAANPTVVPTVVPPFTPTWMETVGVADTLTVCAVDVLGNTLTTYVGTVSFTSSDTLAALPASYTFKLADAGCVKIPVTFGTTENQWLKVNDVTTPLGPPTALWGEAFFDVFLPNSYRFAPLDAPVRLLDTRYNNGLNGAFTANTPRAFLIANRGGVPWCATAVTGNITVTDATAGWAVFLGPTSQAAPTSSTVNFTKGQTVANNVTVQLSPTGYLWATYISTAGNTADLVFDATGYYGCEGDNYFYPAYAPVRVLDTRVNTGGIARLTAGSPVHFTVTGVPDDATAVTGNLTVANATAAWAVYLGPTSQQAPSSSTVNFTAGQTVANGVTVKLGHLNGDAVLYATYISYAGNTTDLVFDVTGYYSDHPQSSWRDNSLLHDGLVYVPMAPTRILDTRNGNGGLGTIPANLPQPFQVTSRNWIPDEAMAVTGNVTVTDSTSGYAIFVGPTPIATPTPTSNINFVAGQILANGMTVAIHPRDPRPAGEKGMLNATYESSMPGATTNLVFDVTGYFIPFRYAHPGLSTTQNPKAGAIGTVLNDTAILSGANFPTGTVTFNLYGPFSLATTTPDCTGTPIYTSPLAGETVSGDSATTTTGWTTVAAGNYFWQATYSGDANNYSKTSTCGELVAIAAAIPTLTTTQVPLTAPAGTTIYDTVTLANAYHPTGMITIGLYSDSSCATQVSGALWSEPSPTYWTGTSTGATAVTTPGWPTTSMPAAPTTYYWGASYSGDWNNYPILMVCGEPVVLTPGP
jgi:hypothetical protein